VVFSVKSAPVKDSDRNELREKRSNRLNAREKNKKEAW